MVWDEAVSCSLQQPRPFPFLSFPFLLFDQFDPFNRSIDQLDEGYSINIQLLSNSGLLFSSTTWYDMAWHGMA
jgi:hypothetical protein